jgi:hypothetical protein
MGAQNGIHLVLGMGLAATDRSQQGYQRQINVELPRQSFHSAHHKNVTRKQSKDTYGQTIQQS